MGKILKHITIPNGLTRKRAVKVQRTSANFSSLDWYKLTESTRHTLNILITECARKQLEERMKEHPDQNRINSLKTLSSIFVELSRDPKVFDSKDNMHQILEQFDGLEVV